MKKIPVVLLLLLAMATPALAQMEDVKVITTIAQLKAGNFLATPRVYPLGYSAANDGGGGHVFQYQPGPCTEDGGVVVKDAAGHCFYRQYSGAVAAEWWGATLGLNADNSAAITAAVNYLNSKGGGELDLFGKYGVAAMIPFKDNIWFRCAGWGTSVLKALSTKNIMGKRAGDPNPTNKNVRVSDCEFDGNSAALPFTPDDDDGNAINIVNVQYAKIEHNYFHHTLNNAIIVYGPDSDDVDIGYSLFQAIGKLGPVPRGYFPSWNAVEVAFGPDRLTVHDFTINNYPMTQYSTRQYGIWFNGSKATAYDFTIRDGYIATPQSDAIRIGLDQGAGTMHAPRVLNVKIYGCGDTGIRLFSADGAGAIEDPVASNNFVQGCTYSGILLDGNSMHPAITNNALVEGNSLSKNGTYNIRNAGTKALIARNRVYGAETDISDVGTATTVSDNKTGP
jgi:hypothetical protein